MNTLDNDNKTNKLQIASIQISINIQLEQVNKIEDERQMRETKAKEDLEATGASKAVDKQSEYVTNHPEEQLTNFEDVMDKRINTDIMPRIGHLDNIAVD